MANAVDRCGTFRFDGVLETGVSENRDDKGALKSVTFSVRLIMDEYWDEEEQQWVDWSEYDMETVGFLNLFYRDKKTGNIISSMTFEQVTKVFGWDGRSIKQLADGDYSQLRGQIRIAENTYEHAKSPFQVVWLDVFDANPVRQLKKLDSAGVSKLDKELALVLQASGKAPVAASAKKSSKPAPPKLAPKPEPKLEEKEAQSEEDHKAKSRERAERLRAEAKKPTPPAKKPQSSPQEGPQVWTKQKAWETIVEVKNDDIDDETLASIWHGKIDEYGGESKVTSDQWSEITHAVLDTEYEEGKTVGVF